MPQRTNLLLLLAMAAGVGYGRFVVPALIAPEQPEVEMDGSIQEQYLEFLFRADPVKCQKWGVSTVDVHNVCCAAIGRPDLQRHMVDGETLIALRESELSILDSRVVFIINNAPVYPNPIMSFGSSFSDGTVDLKRVEDVVKASQLRIRDLVSPIAENDQGSVLQGEVLAISPFD